MDVEEYRKKNQFSVETPSGMTFRMRTVSLEVYDEFMQFLDNQGLDPEDPDEKKLMLHSGSIANILLPRSCIEPEVLPVGSELENPSAQLKVSEIEPDDILELLNELMDKMGAAGERAEDRQNFRGEE